MGTDLEAFLDRCDDVLADWEGGVDAMRYRAGIDRGQRSDQADRGERERPAHRVDGPDASWRVWFPWSC